MTDALFHRMLFAYDGSEQALSAFRNEQPRARRGEMDST